MLLHPTVELVNAEAEEFDRKYQLVEEAITELVSKFPHNIDIAHVLLKVVVVNSLYGAGIPQKYVDTGAESQGTWGQTGRFRSRETFPPDILKAFVDRHSPFSTPQRDPWPH